MLCTSGVGHAHRNCSRACCWKLTTPIRPGALIRSDAVAHDVTVRSNGSLMHVQYIMPHETLTYFDSAVLRVN